ncbi:MAG TPA: class IV adenylate cyclase [Flavobacteriaceae bacterium]|nr:class IV adenylate cyclase [Flavobacteriaceae bacterium]
MSITNVEIKAKSNRQHEIRKILLDLKADFKGEDHQLDTYFNVNRGRLKLREGNIENNLIHYLREDQKGPKQADIILYRINPDSTLKSILTEALGVWKEVDKKREIYFIDNVKFHIDKVKTLGTFVEIEAIDQDGTIGKEKLNINVNTI